VSLDNSSDKFEDEIFTCCSASFSTSIKGLSCNESLIGIFSDVDGNPLFAKFEGIKGGIAILIYYNATGEIYLGTVYYCCSSGGGGAVTDGDYGDITVSSGGTNWTINSLAVTNSMINDMDASKLNTDVNHRVVTDAQIATWNALIGGSVFQTTWNATTNSPTLASGVGTKGYYYIVATAGSTNLDGITDWKIGDWAIFDGTVWRKVDNTDAVSSVNGLTGAVSLDSSNVPDTLNKRYVTDADLVEIATIPDKLNQVQTLKLISIGF
jgi:hypothetical protein